MGIEIKLITADEAYHDKDDSLFRGAGVIVTTSLPAKISLPENVDGECGTVFLDGTCNIPMAHVACEAQNHEYRCGAATGQCHRSSICTQCYFISVDNGLFQQIPHATGPIKRAYDICKNCERPFNLLKNQTGLETVRVRSQHATMARCTLSSIALLLIKIAGARRKKTTVSPQ